MFKVALILIIVTLGLVSTQVVKNFELGARVAGDELLHTETQRSQLTQHLTQHSLIFVWRGNNETYSLIQLETNGWDTWSSVSPAESTSLHLRWFGITITNNYVTQAIITIRVYGLKNQYQEIDSVSGYDIKAEQAITTTSGVNNQN